MPGCGHIGQPGSLSAGRSDRLVPGNGAGKSPAHCPTVHLSTKGFRMFRILLIAMLLAGCVQLPPSPQDLQAKRFDAVPGKAVIYVVRAPMDSPASSGLSLDDREQITTLEGTYYR